MKGNFRQSIIIALLSVLLLISFISILRGEYVNLTTKKTTENHTMVLEKIKALGRLELVNYSIRDIVEITKDNPILPDEKILVVVYGEVIAGIDLSGFTEKNIRVEGDGLLLTLQKPILLQSRIDHEKSHVYDTKLGFLSTGGLISADLVDEAYKSAEASLPVRAEEMGYLQTAEENGKKLLIPMLESISNKKISIEYK